jgi:putative transposase
MPKYRRNHQPDGLYFFTVTLKDRSKTLLTDHIDSLKQSLTRVQKESPYLSKAIVVLPDHLHAIWQLPGEDQNYSLRWRKIKAYFTHSLNSRGVPIEKNKHGKFTVWQQQFWEHTIRDVRDFENHVNYIHYNPVKHGLVSRVRDWPYSSFHRYVRRGILDLHWGDVFAGDDQKYGE